MADSQILYIVLVCLQGIFCLLSIILLFVIIGKAVFNNTSVMVKILLLCINISCSVYSFLILIGLLFLLIKDDLSLFKSLYPFRRNIHNCYLIFIYMIYFTQFYILLLNKNRIGNMQKWRVKFISFIICLLILLGLETLFILTNWYISAILLVLMFHINMIYTLSCFICSVPYLSLYLQYTNTQKN